jgi:hypothetical protein
METRRKHAEDIAAICLGKSYTTKKGSFIFGHHCNRRDSHAIMAEVYKLNGGDWDVVFDVVVDETEASVGKERQFLVSWSKKNTIVKEEEGPTATDQ